MKKQFFLLITICGVMLTGCAQLVDLTDNESDVLAEYMAGTMLKYDSNYKEALIYPEETIENEDISETDNIMHVSTDNKTVDQSQTPEYTKVTQKLPANTQNITLVSAAEVFKDILKNHFSVTYQGYKTYGSYVDENDLYAIEAAKGNKIVAFQFNIKNVTNKQQKLALLNKKISYQLVDKDNNVYYPSMTLLNNDIQYINVRVNAGKTKKAVILFELPKNADVSKMMLSLAYEDEIAVIDISR